MKFKDKLNLQNNFRNSYIRLQPVNEGFRSTCRLTKICWQLSQSGNNSTDHVLLPHRWDISRTFNEGRTVYSYQIPYKHVDITPNLLSSLLSAFWAALSKPYRKE